MPSSLYMDDGVYGYCQVESVSPGRRKIIRAARDQIRLRANIMCSRSADAQAKGQLRVVSGMPWQIESCCHTGTCTRCFTKDCAFTSWLARCFAEHGLACHRGRSSDGAESQDGKRVNSMRFSGTSTSSSPGNRYCDAGSRQELSYLPGENPFT